MKGAMMRNNTTWNKSRKESVLEALTSQQNDPFIDDYWAEEEIRQKYYDKLTNLGYVIDHAWNIGPFWFAFHSPEHPEVTRMMCEVKDININSIEDLIISCGGAAMYYTQDTVVESFGKDFEETIPWFVYDLVHVEWFDDRVEVYWKPGFAGSMEAYDLIHDEIEAIEAKYPEVQ